MDIEEFKRQLPELQEQLSPYRKIIIGDSDLPFAIGFKYNEENKKWYIFENDEFSNQLIRYEKDSETETVNFFYQMIQFEIKKQNKYLEWLKKSGH